ncbi:MAG: hypothetical protein IRZ11_08690 [Clostridia bacterium]|nr:hypothetical protein [Clostridia bacterium]
MNIWVYTLARAVHGVFAAILAWLLWPKGLTGPSGGGVPGGAARAGAAGPVVGAGGPLAGSPATGTVPTVAGWTGPTVSTAAPGHWLAAVGPWHEIAVRSLDGLAWALLVLVAVAITTAVGSPRRRVSRRS